MSKSFPGWGESARNTTTINSTPRQEPRPQLEVGCFNRLVEGAGIGGMGGFIGGGALGAFGGAVSGGAMAFACTDECAKARK